MDDAWCSTWPRCSLFGCCKRCHRPNEPHAEPVRRVVTLDGHPRTLVTQTHALLDAGLAALPFTTPGQFEQLGRREVWRGLYVAHGQSLAKLPREYAALAARDTDQLHSAGPLHRAGGSAIAPRRQLLFLAFDKNASRARATVRHGMWRCHTAVCERLRTSENDLGLPVGAVIHFVRGSPPLDPSTHRRVASSRCLCRLLVGPPCSLIGRWVEACLHSPTRR
jgi:hypothetical protein